MIAISSMFAASEPMLLTFDETRSVFVREYLTGTYGVAAWMFIKTMIEIPKELFFQLEVTLITYWIVGFQANFFYLVICLFLIAFCASTTALFFGSLGPDAKSSMELAPMIFVPQILFAGFLIPITQIPEWIRWAEKVCFLKYGIDLIGIFEFRDEYEGLPRKEQTVWLSLDVYENEWWWTGLIMICFILVVRCAATVFVTYRTQVIH